MSDFLISPRAFRYSSDGSKQPVGSKKQSAFFNARTDSKSPIKTPTSDLEDAQTMYENGIHFASEGKFNQACSEWFEASEYGHVGAQKKLALAYLCGIGVQNPSDEEATYFFQRASSQGDRTAMVAMGSLNSLGRGVCDGEPDFAAAAALWTQASKLGSDLAGLKHATLLLEGVPDVIDANIPKAVEWFQSKAGEVIDVESQISIVTPPESAQQNISKTGDSVTLSCLLLGLARESGLLPGVKKNSFKARLYYLMSQKGGCAAANACVDRIKLRILEERATKTTKKASKFVRGEATDVDSDSDSDDDVNSKDDSSAGDVNNKDESSAVKEVSAAAEEKGVVPLQSTKPVDLAATTETNTSISSRRPSFKLSKNSIIVNGNVVASPKVGPLLISSGLRSPCLSAAVVSPTDCSSKFDFDDLEKEVGNFGDISSLMQTCVTMKGKMDDDDNSVRNKHSGKSEEDEDEDNDNEEEDDDDDEGDDEEEDDDDEEEEEDDEDDDGDENESIQPFLEFEGVMDCLRAIRGIGVTFEDAKIKMNRLIKAEVRETMNQAESYEKAEKMNENKNEVDRELNSEEDVEIKDLEVSDESGSVESENQERFVNIDIENHSSADRNELKSGDYLSISPSPTQDKEEVERVEDQAGSTKIMKEQVVNTGEKEKESLMEEEEEGGKKEEREDKEEEHEYKLEAKQDENEKEENSVVHSVLAATNLKNKKEAKHELSSVTMKKMQEKEDKYLHKKEMLLRESRETFDLMFQMDTDNDAITRTDDATASLENIIDESREDENDSVMRSNRLDSCDQVNNVESDPESDGLELEEFALKSPFSLRTISPPPPPPLPPSSPPKSLSTTSTSNRPKIQQGSPKKSNRVNGNSSKLNSSTLFSRDKGPEGFDIDALSAVSLSGSGSRPSSVSRDTSRSSSGNSSSGFISQNASAPRPVRRKSLPTSDRKTNQRPLPPALLSTSPPASRFTSKLSSPHGLSDGVGCGGGFSLRGGRQGSANESRGKGGRSGSVGGIPSLTAGRGRGGNGKLVRSNSSSRSRSSQALGGQSQGGKGHINRAGLLSNRRKRTLPHDSEEAFRVVKKDIAHEFSRTNMTAQKVFTALNVDEDLEICMADLHQLCNCFSNYDIAGCGVYGEVIVKRLFLQLGGISSQKGVSLMDLNINWDVFDEESGHGDDKQPKRSDFRYSI